MVVHCIIEAEGTMSEENEKDQVAYEAEAEEGEHSVQATVSYRWEAEASRWKFMVCSQGITTCSVHSSVFMTPCSVSRG